MTIEAAVLLNKQCEPVYWHAPVDRTAVRMEDSRALWDAIWENRANLLGLVHTHPGSGIPHPTHEDLTTFEAVESGIARRLSWGIMTVDAFAVYRWRGILAPRWGGRAYPGPLDYADEMTFEHSPRFRPRALFWFYASRTTSSPPWPEWIDRLRELSGFPRWECACCALGAHDADRCVCELWCPNQRVLTISIGG